MSAAQTKTKKSAVSKPKATAKSKASAKSTSHPPFADIIRECIASAGDRSGVSRPTIKKYIEEKYKMEVTASVISNINRSITYGAEKGTFVLPKGPSGKVKLAPKKGTSESAKENARPAKAPAPIKKTTASKPVAKSKAAVKPVKKSATSAKKSTKSAAPVKKASAKRAPAKKSITGTPKTTTKARTSTKAKPAASKPKATPKKTSATAPASKRKPTSKAVSTKPASAKK